MTFLLTLILCFSYTAITLPHSVVASPFSTKLETIRHLLGRDTFEWTALGDSYSSGVGAGEYDSACRRCLRYDDAYPRLINNDGRLPSGSHLFNNVVCSGSSTKDVEAYQFYDKDEFAKPDASYGGYLSDDANPGS